MKEETIFKTFKKWSDTKAWKDESLIVLEFLDDIFGKKEVFTKKYEKWCKKKEGRVVKRSKTLNSS